MKIGISGINGRVGSVLKNILLGENPAYAGMNAAIGFARQADSMAEIPVTNEISAFLEQADMVIDFSLPSNFITLAEKAGEYDVPIVSGTTGMDDAQNAALEEAAKKTAILHAGNMSLGVNLLCALVKQSAARLGIDYDIEVSETHHRMKRDAPSGTALMLGKSAAEGRNVQHDDVAVYGRNGADALRQEGEIGYAVQRGGSVIGAHDVSFFGPSEEVKLSHSAHNRELFAEGALFAAKWLKDKHAGKLYSMADALDL